MVLEVEQHFGALWNAEIGPLCELIVVNGSRLALVRDLERLTDEVILSHGFARVLDAERTPVLDLAAFLGPVLVALDFAAFHQSGGHDNNARVILPDHLPEVTDCVLLRALGADEGATLVESVCKGCIDVVVVIAEVSVSDFDARVVVAWDVIVAIAQHIVRFA